MRLTKGRTLLAGAIVFGGALVFLAVHSLWKPTLRLADGTVLRLEKVDYGKQPPYQLDAWRYWLLSVIEHLPAWLSRNFPNLLWRGTWSGGELPAPGEDALYISLTRRDASSGKEVDTGLYWAEILDEHGCHFISARAGGMTHHQNSPGPRYEVAWFAFQAFPRRQRQFRLRLYEPRKTFVGEFIVPNPAPARAADWKVEPLPITRRVGDMSFTLESISLQASTNASGTNLDHIEPAPLIAPQFTIRENGRPAKDWEAAETELFDSTGNQPSRWPFKGPFLCPFEPAWKLRVQFCGSETTHAGSNDCWNTSSLVLPAPGSFSAVTATQRSQNVTIRLIGLAGPGHTTYSNGVPAAARASRPLEKQDYSETSSGSGSGGVMSWVSEIQTPIPHVALAVSGLGETQRISVRATDDQGRKSYATTWEWDFQADGFRENQNRYLRLRDSASQLHILGLHVPADARKLTLTFCVHGVRTVEFVVQPPRPEP